MNYRHAYHAGNHADVLKHIVLARMIEHLKQKETPFRVLDAHGGIGLYELASVEAEKTFEWRDGVGRLFAQDGSAIALADEVEALIAPWRACVASVNTPGALGFYPGSPQIAQDLLRPNDRLRFNELHPVDYETLARRYGRDRRAGVTRLDALVFLKSQLPPPERRGLVLIDPPYEKTDEAERAVRMVSESLKRFSTGVYCLWYPVTGDGLDRRLRVGVAVPHMLTVQMNVRAAKPDGGLAGSGMLIINPPWRLEEELRVILPALCERLTQGEASWTVESAAP